MKKIDHYKEDPFQFYKDVVKSKRNKDQVKLLQKIEIKVEKSYAEYGHEFERNTLGRLNSVFFTPEQKTSLEDLYGFKRKAFDNLFHSLTTDAGNHRNMDCPMCTISDSQQLDHYVPRSEFPEFAANPLNLIPCCSTCNAKKGNKWREGSEPVFLNLYLDDLPKAQYLFVDVNTEGEVPLFGFSVCNVNNIDASLFKRIECHYRRLDLCKRFSEHSDAVISEINSYYTSALNCFDQNFEQSSERFWSIVRNHAIHEQTTKGYNYWKSILTLECCDNPKVRQYIESYKGLSIK